MKRAKKKHVCANHFYGEGGRGACIIEIEPGEREGYIRLVAGWSCVVVHQKEVPISWITEVLAIATAHKGGIAGFLAEHDYAGGYALKIDPPPIKKEEADAKTRRADTAPPR